MESSINSEVPSVSGLFYYANRRFESFVLCLLVLVMALLDKLVLVVCVSAIVTARTTSAPEEVPAQPQDTPSYDPQDDSYNPLTIQQLPSVAVPNIPFQIPEPSGELRPPQFYDSPPVSFLDVPVPAIDLKAPSQNTWNPENNPIFYYELPASLTKLDTPTNQFPKKFNKEIHSKDKPLSTQPKMEIELVPIDEKDLVIKKNSLDKKFNKLAKLQNRKELDNLKAQ